MNPDTATAPIRVVPRRSVTQEASACGSGACASSTPLKTLCSNCHLRDICLPCGMGGSDVERLDGLMFGRRRIKAGEELYRAGDRFQFIYAVRSGTFKSSLMHSDGREQVSGFHMAGELMGLDGVANGRHASAATALEDAEICAIPYAHLTELASGSTEMQLVMAQIGRAHV